MRKDISERVGIAETKLDEHGRRLDSLESARQDEAVRREKMLVEGMWLCVKAMAIATFVTVTTPRLRDALAKFWGYFFQ